MANEIRIDALLPPEMARRAEYLGVSKAEAPALRTFVLAILAGAFIGLGAIFATTVSAGSAALPYGVAKLLIGLVFCLGLILVVIGGAELFTGNNLIVMAWANGKVSTARLLRNWLIVYAGNFVGSIGTAVIMLLSAQYRFAGGAIGLNALNIAHAKAGLAPFQAIWLGAMCNSLVCLAVWLTFSARSTTDKIMAILFPITAFVAAGFEHSVANMYFVPMGLLVKRFGTPAFWDAIGKTAADYPNLTWGNFVVHNLLPVTLGNIIGGGILVGLVYWFVYLRPKNA
jgi:formate transporter